MPSIRFAQDFSVVNVDFVTIEGRLVKGRIHDTVLTPAAADAPNAPPLAAIKQANVVLDFPQLAELHALIRAISPPEPRGEADRNRARPRATAAPVTGAGPRNGRDRSPRASRSGAASRSKGRGFG